jgi:PadR family transcriptional regulator PadR
MAPPFRMTKQTRLLLGEMLADPAGDHYGFEISKATGLRPSTLYPTFSRLEEAGWISGRWEDLTIEKTGRPPRRYYRLTSHGAAQAAEALKVDGPSRSNDSPGAVGA